MINHKQQELGQLQAFSPKVTGGTIPTDKNPPASGTFYEDSSHLGVTD